jgi:hypothetical protein
MGSAASGKVVRGSMVPKRLRNNALKESYNFFWKMFRHT